MPPPKPAMYAIQRSGSASVDDDVAIRADDEAGVLAARVELQHRLVLLVRLARGAERAEHAAFDGGDVRRAQADGGAELVVRVGVARVRGDALARERERAVERVAEGRGGLGRRRRRGRSSVG